jgi:hypothetical protein
MTIIYKQVVASEYQEVWAGLLVKHCLRFDVAFIWSIKTAHFICEPCLRRGLSVENTPCNSKLLGWMSVIGRMCRLLVLPPCKSFFGAEMFLGFMGYCLSLVTHWHFTPASEPCAAAGHGKTLEEIGDKLH